MIRCLWMLFALLVAVPVRAQDEPAPAAEPTAFERIDDAFGTYFVGPMAAVIFFDLVFWDDQLPLGEGVGTTVGDEVVAAHGPDGYVLEKRVQVPLADARPLLDEGATQAIGSVTVGLREEDGTLVGRVRPATLPLAPCADVATCGTPYAEWSRAPLQVVGVDAETTDTSAWRVLTDRASFPVLVAPTTTGELEIVPTDVRLPWSAAPVQVGGRARAGEVEGSVAAVEGEQVTLVAATRTEAGPLANPANTQLPIIVAWLVAGAVFLTLRMAFINLRGFWHAIQVTSGAYDDPHDTGDISHFQALASALSATVGLGNIAGVAIAVGLGGPGAIFWMIVAGFLGMSSKFTECTLGQMYRTKDATGHISGGPMHYLHRGLAELGLGGFGRVLAIVFAVMCIGGSLGGGNMFQANQSYVAVAEVVPLFQGRAWLYGLMMAVCVALVILGGIKRIGAAAGMIVPVMCGIYLLAGVWILVTHASHVPWALTHIVTEAFTPEAGYGGLIGVLVMGFRRAAFSNEAGIGSASIAHSAAATNEPVREGIVALLEPFIDTIVVCTMTGLVVVITGTYKTHAGDGVLMTAAAFETVIPWFPLVLTFAVVMFAYSTQISWSYYGERCATYLLGESASLPYKLLFVVAAFFGAVLNLDNVLTFSDLMVLGMAFPNMLGLFLLSGKVKERLDDYWARYQSGQMKPVAKPARAK